MMDARTLPGADRPPRLRLLPPEDSQPHAGTRFGVRGKRTQLCVVAPPLRAASPTSARARFVHARLCGT